MYHIFAVSDASGETAERVVRAALVQFHAPDITITRCGGVRTAHRIHEIVTEAAQAGGFIVHTFVYANLRHVMLTEGRAANVTTIDLMGPLLARLSELLAVQPLAEPGLFQPFDAGYMERIYAMDFAVRHDDGRNIDDLEKAQIVLVGVSRTSKTPLSIYLAYRGWRVANVPLVLGIEPPSQLWQLPRRRAVGLVIHPERLVELRKARSEHLGIPALGYADLEHIRHELTYAYEFYSRRPDWPLVDVTAKPIEETAAEVVSLLGHSMPDSGE